MKKQLVESIHFGNVVIMPTDTVYGICCRFDDAKAVRRVGTIKGRQKRSGFVLLVSDEAMLEDYIIGATVPQILFEDTCPTTYVYQNHKPIVPECLHTDGSVAVRISQNPLISELVKSIGLPLATTSANFHNQKTPSSFDEIDPCLKQKVDFCFPQIHEIEKSMTHQPSRILEVNNGNIKIIRDV